MFRRQAHLTEAAEVQAVELLHVLAERRPALHGTLHIVPPHGHVRQHTAVLGLFAGNTADSQPAAPDRARALQSSGTRGRRCERAALCLPTSLHT